MRASVPAILAAFSFLYIAIDAPASAQFRASEEGVSFGNGDVTITRDGVRIGNDDVVIEADDDPAPPPSSGRASSGGYAAYMDGRKFVNVDMPRSNMSDRSLREAVIQSSDFRGANFSDSDLSGAKLQSSKFGGANFSGATLLDARLQSSSFSGANFRSANLRDARLQSADFSGANFRNACLVEARIQNANLSGANFNGAILVGADFSGSSLAAATTSGAVFDGPATCPGEQARAEVTGAAEIEQALSAGANASIDLTVNFPHDSADIEGKAHVQIYEIASALKADSLSNMRIRIEGHTDSTGEDSYNMDLSYRRALSVLRALTEEYEVDNAMLQVQGFGESQPVASNETEAGRSLNRRVTLVNLGAAE